MNSVFSPLRIQEVAGESGGRQLWQLTRQLRMNLSVNGGSVVVSVPDGFVTDFASVPRALWPVFPPSGPWCKAAVIHDYLYQSQTCSRFLADAIFREAMAQLGVPIWRRVVMYYAVRLFGGLARKREVRTCE
jgi:hypothetical protein